MVVANGHEFITLRDEMYVNGKRVYEVYVNGVKVYPEGVGDALYLVDHSGSMGGRDNEVIEVLNHYNFGKSYAIGSIAGGNIKIAVNNLVLKSN